VFEFKHFLQAYKEKFNEDLQKQEQFYGDDKYLYLILNSWKFYPRYPEVRYIINFVEQEDLEDYIGMIAIHEDDTKDEWGNPNEIDLYTCMEIEGM